LALSPRKRPRSHYCGASIAPLPGTFVDEVLRDAHADLLFTVRYAEQEALLYVLLEHKSEVDRWTLLQLLCYMLRIWERYLAVRPAFSRNQLPPA
jgi:predicted transposase YdaD